jgi:hypothetical protein
MEAPNKIWLDQSVSDPDELCLYYFTENPSQKSIEYIRAGKVLESLATLTSERDALKGEVEKAEKKHRELWEETVNCITLIKGRVDGLVVPGNDLMRELEMGLASLHPKPEVKR